MPLPKEPFTIHGGCRCKAIRYEVSVPAYEDRPQTVYKSRAADIGDLRLPAVYVDHCNDCRSATSAILPMVLVSIMETARVSVLPRMARAEYAFDIPGSDREWLAANEVFHSDVPKLEDSYLSVYKSSPGRSRWFCNRCGTMFGYSADKGVIPKDWGWPAMLDIWLGTIDREDLEKDYMKPERIMWSEMGIPWVQEFVRGGAGGIPEHPLTKIDKVMGDDLEDDLNELRQVGRNL